MSELLPLYDVSTARAGILRRDPPDVYAVPDSLLDGIEQRFGERLNPEGAVRKVLADIRERGDAALFEWTRRIDNLTLDNLAVPPERIRSAPERIPAEVREALVYAAARIRDFHERQPSISWMHSTTAGMLGQLVRPVERVGVYVPGGTAPLPSTLLMCAVPAQVAGVQDIIICTPSEDDVIYAAAAILGIDRIFTLGGAQAVGAMAYG
ncbi:MAG: histidinol dehydrogenase, partial [Anaerolineales bacterium]